MNRRNENAFTTSSYRSHEHEKLSIFIGFSSFMEYDVNIIVQNPESDWPTYVYMTQSSWRETLRKVNA